MPGLDAGTARGDDDCRRGGANQDPPAARPARSYHAIDVLVKQPAGFAYFDTAEGGPDASTAAALYTGNFGGGAGKTYRFVVSLDQPATFTGYTVLLTALDPAAIDYAMGSLTSLSGLNFNPMLEQTFNDGTPGQAFIGPVNLAGTPVTSTELFRLDYVVQEWYVGVPTPYFSVALTGFSSAGDTINPDADTAVLEAVSAFPEPGTLLLLAAGLPLLSALGRNRARP